MLTVKCQRNMARKAGRSFLVTIYIASPVSKMPSLSPPNILLLAHTLSSAAHPLHDFSESHVFALKRRVIIRSRTIAGGFATAIVLLLLFWIAICLGRQRERTGTWYCWRETGSGLYSKSKALPELRGTPEPNRRRSRITWPNSLSSSAPAELESPINPAEADSRSPFLELSSKEIYEMESPSPSPRRPSWWNRYSDRRKEANATSAKSLDEVEVAPTKQPSYPEAAHVPSRNTEDEEEQSESSGPTSMDRRGSGMEYVRQVYAQRKTDLAVEGTPWY